MTNREIAILLRNIAAAYELLGESRFRISAYYQAADSVENLSKDLKSIWQAGNIQKVPGIGGSLAQHFDELFTKGESAHFKNIEAKMPTGMFDFLKLRGVGPKTAFRLAKELHERDIQGNSSIVRLSKLLNSHALLELEGFGTKRENEIAEALSQYRAGVTKKKRLLLPQAEAVADKLCSYIKSHSDVIYAHALGSLRRRKETIGDIDLSVAIAHPQDLIPYILKYPDIRKVDDKGETRLALLLDGGIQVDVRLIEPASYGSMLQYFTGSKYHNIKLREYALTRGYSLSEWGIKSTAAGKDELKKCTTEEEFYQYIGLPWIPPEMREDRGEIEMAVSDKLPSLVTLEDIKGDLHIHGDFAYPSSHDLGTSSLSALTIQSQVYGYEYIGISDHNPKNSGISVGDKIELMKKRVKYYENNIGDTKNVQKNPRVIKVFNMLEIDIRPNGELALPQEAFSTIDAAIASIHSSFVQDRETMTSRILKGLSHHKVRIFGHPTGRLINSREGVQADWKRIFEYCKERDIALEINASPQRLDLPDTLIHEARECGLKFIISTDSHHVDHMSNMRYGVSVARRGFLTKDDILNTLPVSKFEKWLAGVR